MPSPIERMIDEACGVKPGDFVTLRCPECNREKRVAKAENDPDGTAVVVAVCDRCDDGSKSLVDYYDGQGRWYGPDGWRAVR